MNDDATKTINQLQTDKPFALELISRVLQILSENPVHLESLVEMLIQRLSSEARAKLENRPKTIVEAVATRLIQVGYVSALFGIAADFETERIQYASNVDGNLFTVGNLQQIIGDNDDIFAALSGYIEGFVGSSSAPDPGVIQAFYFDSETESEPAAFDATVSENDDLKCSRQEVSFATNRKLEENGDFGSRRSSHISYGGALVSIPEIHRIGSLERPAFWKFEFREDRSRHVTLQSLNPMTDDEFFASIREAEDRSACVFVHGYRTTFKDALLRTGQLKADLEFSGTMILFSWPSSGNAIQYAADEATIEWAQPDLERLLVELAERCNLDTIHIISHSLGSRAVATSMQNIGGKTDRRPYENVVFAAPDIDRGVFLRSASEIVANSNNVTLYVSSSDRALLASERLHNAPRAGSTSKMIVVDGMTTVDASSMNTDFLGHSYMASSRVLLTDLVAMIRGDKPPRYGYRSIPPEGASAWRFNP